MPPPSAFHQPTPLPACFSPAPPLQYCSVLITVGATLNEYRADSWPVGYDSEFDVRSQNSFYKRTSDKKDRLVQGHTSANFCSSTGFTRYWNAPTSNASYTYFSYPVTKAEEMELFKKEFYEDLSKVTNHRTVSNAAVNISEAAFKAMKEDPQYREKVLSLIILERPYVKRIIHIFFIPCYKNDDGLFLRLHAPDTPCQPHAVQTCAGASHLSRSQINYSRSRR